MTERRALVAIAAGGLLSLILGLYGRIHGGTGDNIVWFGFSSMISMKVWFATAVGILAVGQLIGALWLYGKLPMPAPSWLGKAHRAGGYVTVALSLPVAFLCLWSLGFQTGDLRTTIHSWAGCLVYGALVTKVIAVRSKDAPGWLLPAAAGTLFATITIAVVLSAGWYITNFGTPS